MLIPLGTVMKASATGSVIREVKCVHCPITYYYVLRRTGRGRRTAHLWIGQREAKMFAAAEAKETLARYLADGVDAVACPNCGYYQPDMIGAAKDEKLSTRKILAWTVVAFFSPLIFVIDQKHESMIGYVMYALGFGVFLALAAIRIAWNPNRDPWPRVGLGKPGPMRFMKRGEAERWLGESPRVDGMKLRRKLAF